MAEDIIKYFAMFDTDGFPVGFYPSDIHEVPPAGAVEITEGQWLELINNQGLRRYVGGEIVAYEPPTPPPPPRIVYKADIWRRATDAEAEAMDAMLDSQPVRLRRMWTDATQLQSDDELFAVIEGALVSAFGAERAGELLE